LSSPSTPGFSTEISSHDLHHIWVRGHDLTRDLIGKLTFTEMVLLLVCGRLPDPAEHRLLDAILVSLVEHGLTPSAAVARVTYAVAPEALQGAVAAGLLGAGSAVLGSMEECGQVLARIADESSAGTLTARRSTPL
jgi:citrate synthase